VNAAPARAAEQMYFAATDNITNVLVQKINAEPVGGRIDMSCWYLTEHAISIALINRFNAGVQVRLIGDRGSIFEIDPITKSEIYWLANQGIPIRLRFNPTWYPEIDHMKMTVFVGQNLVTFGSANYTPFELAPASPTNYKDESVLLSDDSALVNAFKTRFDQLWNDTTPEPNSLIPEPPYFKNFHDACAAEPTGNCADFATRYPNPAPMIINTNRLEPNYPTPAGLIWGQGPQFNNRLVQEINAENTLVQFVIYRLTVDNITQALLNKWQSGVPVQLLVEPGEYLNRKWPEFWLTHANLDKLWAAGVPMRQRAHDGLTHMKTLVTSNYATVASSNYASAWQRDDNYFIPRSSKPALWQVVKDRVTAMWNNTTAFTAFVPQPPDAPGLASPLSGTTNAPLNTTLVWTAGAFAVSYDIYGGPSASNLVFLTNVPAQLVNNPPSQYSWQPAGQWPGSTTIFWKVVARTNATSVNPSLVASSSTWSFTTTAGSSGPPPAPSNPNPTNGATGVSTNPTLTWAAGAPGTTFNVAFGTSSNPPQVATGLTSSTFTPGSLSANTPYFWKVTAVSSGGSTAGPTWSFTTGGGGGASDIVIYASDIANGALHGGWSKANDSTAADGIMMLTPDVGLTQLNAPLASPDDFVDVTFSAPAGTTYRLWLRIRALNNAKANDAVWVQFSDARSGGSSIYPLNTTSGLLVNLATDGTGSSLNGWGWQNTAYWLSQPTAISFAAGGNHTMRIQIREDGAQIDQIVLSPSTYFGSAPGPATNDNTIVPKPGPPPPPTPPANPNPASGATGISLATTLTWTSSGATSYDVFFGTSNPPPIVSSNQAAASYSASGLSEDTPYFWQIVARNSVGTATGPIWSFTTVAAPPPPSTPSGPSPVNGATGVSLAPTLTWSSSGATSYDIRFGTNNPPPIVSSDQAAASFSASGLSASTTYFWQIVARNNAGTTTGPTWSFTTVAAPPPPSTPSGPSPVNGATGVSLAPTLTWSSSGATSYDVRFGTNNPPPIVSSDQAAASFSASGLSASTTYFWQIVARNGAGTTTGPTWSLTTSAPPPADIVIYASDFSPADFHGVWTTASDATAANGVALTTPDLGVSQANAPLSSPNDYVETTFFAPAGIPYRFWMRIRALGNSKFNDAVWVQISEAGQGGAAYYPIGSTSGLLVNLATDSGAASLNQWGWGNGAYWLSQPASFVFSSTGTHTIRIQTREDGAFIDQIVLSPGTYFSNPPGGPTNDSTIVPKP
jgi:hypothetical protein